MIIDDRIEKYDAYVIQSRIAAMKNVIADRRLTQKGEEGRADSTLVHPPNTPIPHVQPRVGYICGLWVLPGRDNSQSKHANADCAKFVFLLYSFLFCHL